MSKQKIWKQWLCSYPGLPSQVIETDGGRGKAKYEYMKSLGIKLFYKIRAVVYKPAK